MKMCEHCNNLFQPVNKLQIYCSRECNAKVHSNLRKYVPYMAPCKGCQKSFLKKKSNQLYCSPVCRLEDNKVTLTCQFCEKIFKRPDNQPINDVIFCSRYCALQNRKQNLNKSMIGNDRPIKIILPTATHDGDFS